MDYELLSHQLSTALDGRHLLSHPFYRRWSEGRVGMDELRVYAGQYRHFEQALPGFLDSIAARAPDDPTRDSVRRNLDDELGDGGASHLELFDRFASAIDAPVTAEPTDAMARLLATYRAAVAAGPASGMAAVLAYEAQAPEVSETKAAGLRDHFGLDDAAVEFWDVHGEIDRDHAEWGLRCVADMTGESDDVRGAMRGAADAWWAFLDERELAVVS